MGGVTQEGGLGGLKATLDKPRTARDALLWAVCGVENPRHSLDSAQQNEVKGVHLGCVASGGPSVGKGLQETNEVVDLGAAQRR